ncbi:isochorismatase family protein [Solimicrobium silvestre]|uniref:Isochorismatase family n=1 Tax=Solimicrobium silvestre TaxID=2099400 RepID=A0A2S9GUX8_9BURK|nr:isochorismatase family protein [Solimicrobium silvestre]PRC91520.1 Isochorismatase family [Solimicrobium silvestre]
MTEITNTLANAASSILIVIDFQAKLIPLIFDGAQVTQRALLLAQAAKLLKIPVFGTEQQPLRLGASIPSLAGLYDLSVQKSTFDACAEPAFLAALEQLSAEPARDELCIVGCEAHVCVLQTVLGLLERGWRVKLVVDAIGSRLESNKLLAVQRAALHGAEIVSSEMLMFEWLRDSEHPHFREVLKLIKPM